MRLTLQNISFPSVEYNNNTEMYFRSCELLKELKCSNEILLNKDEGIITDTYYNSFSIGKWNKYTNLDNLILSINCKGKFDLFVINKKLINSNKIEEKILIEKDIDGLNNTVIENSNLDGMICFKLVSKEDNAKFLGGSYATNIDKHQNINIAINICTFKRERFVEKNLNLIETTVLNNDEYKDNFKVFVCDNGKTLSTKKSNEKIKIFGNKNTGGSGGFTRGLIEILNDQDVNNFTHCLFMDDDILLTEEVLIRTINFLRILKSEYIDCFVCGGMISLDTRYLQTESMDVYKVSTHMPIKYNYDLRGLKNVLDNEIEEDANYCSWWYCCMPINKINKDNLPLPLFIKRDDVEYGLRNGTTFISLNGISVLHEDFNNKRAGYLEYYYWRNRCIINAIHRPTYTKKDVKKQLLKTVIKSILTYRYNDANIALKGVEDYLKGIEFLENNDAEKINNKIRYFTYNLKGAETLDVNIDLLNKAKLEYKYDKSNSKVDIIKAIFLFFFKAKGTGYTTAYRARISDVIGKKIVINFSKNDENVFITKKSFQQAINVILNYIKLRRIINKKYIKITEEYKNNYKRLTNIEFWKKYLNENLEYVDKSVIKNGDLVDYKRAIKMFIIYNICSIFRCIEHIFSFLLPIKTNRVTFILNRKSEIACNIKYLINDIKEKFGNQVDIRLITLDNKDYKDNNGFKVYKINSIKACFIQFTSKVVVTNDAFQELPYKRKKQYFINVWHGAMNYKHIGTNYLTYVSKCDKKRFIRRNVQPDLFVAGSEYFLNDTASSFNFDKKIFINSGLPRNDIFFKDTSSLQKAIKERLNIKETDKVLIYAPTFRRTKKKSKYDLDTDRLTRNLSNKFGGNWVILYRSHYFVDEKNELVDKNIIDVSKYPDINELLIISDALITDYSSCMWDFSLGDNIKPVFIYAPDLDFYKNGDRTLSYNLENGPYPIAINKDMLETNISNFDNDKYIENVKNHLKECNSFDDGNATTRISNIIMSELKLK